MGIDCCDAFLDYARRDGAARGLSNLPTTSLIVTARFVDPDYRMRMAIEDMVAALRSAK